MAKVVKGTEETKEVKEFNIPLNEFLSSVSNKEVEMKSAFAQLMSSDGGRKPKSSWTELYNLFKSQPVKMSWAAWLKQNKGGI